MIETMRYHIRTMAAIFLMATACSSPTEPTSVNADGALKTKDLDKTIHLEYYPSGKLKSAVILDADSAQTVTAWFNDSTGLVAHTAVKTMGRQDHFVEYYSNGRPMGLVNFDSTTTGDAFYYYPNGQKREDGKWFNGEQRGIWRHYSEDGTLIRVDTLK